MHRNRAQARCILPAQSAISASVSAGFAVDAQPMTVVASAVHLVFTLKPSLAVQARLALGLGDATLVALPFYPIQFHSPSTPKDNVT
jgi:hypothetical protein